MQTPSKHSGFTLIELMIVVAIVAILAAIAYPSYQDSVRKSNRREAMSTLVDMQLNQEKSRANGVTYLNTAAYEAAYTTMAALAALDTKYTFTIVGGTATAFSVQATPVVGSDQANDSQGAVACAVLAVDQAGTKTPAACW